jgi:hypothetical protein
MGKRTHQTNDRSGSKFYKYEDGLVELLPTFIYEVTLSKYWENGFCQLGSKLYKADRLLHIKNNYVVTKYEGYYIKKEISLIGVPQEFIDEMNLSLYVPESNKKSKKKCKKQKK